MTHIRGLLQVSRESTVEVVRVGDTPHHTLRLQLVGSTFAFMLPPGEDGPQVLAAYLRSVAENALLVSAKLDPAAIARGRESLRREMAGSVLVEWLTDAENPDGDGFRESGVGRPS